MSIRFSRTFVRCAVVLATFTLTQSISFGDEEAGAPRGACPGSGDCFSANGTPGCDDADCCNAVCAQDPFCCNNEWDSLCASQAASICGPGGSCVPSCSAFKENIECFVGTPQYQNRRPIGRMLRFGSSWCTAWIVAGPNIVMTNQHCVAAGIAGLTVEFNFECDDCIDGSEKTTETFNVVSLIRQNAGLDYAILQLSGNPAATWGVLPVGTTPSFVGQSIYEIHHGEGLVKGYDEGTVTAVNIPGDCGVNPPSAIAVNAVATGGASGSPIFDASSHCVVAICHCGPPCSPGFGVSMSAVMPDAMASIISAGGTLATCAPCPGADGDVNDDSVVDGRDIAAFVSATLNGATQDEICHGDFSSNGSLGDEDIAGLTAALVAP